MQCGRRVWTAGQKNICSSIVRYRACLQLTQDYGHLAGSPSELWSIGLPVVFGGSVVVVPVAATAQNAIIALSCEWWAVSLAVCWPVQLPGHTDCCLSILCSIITLDWQTKQPQFLAAFYTSSLDTWTIDGLTDWMSANATVNFFNHSFWCWLLPADWRSGFLIPLWLAAQFSASAMPIKWKHA